MLHCKVLNSKFSRRRVGKYHREEHVSYSDGGDKAEVRLKLKEGSLEHHNMEFGVLACP